MRKIVEKESYFVMPLTDLIAGPITGVWAFNGLPVDDVMWNESHNQHHTHRRLHLLAAHRPGIVTGLDVIALGGTGANQQSLVVAPGVGIDTDGQVVVLREPVTLPLKERGQSYVILYYNPTRDPDSSVTLDGGGVDYWRVREGREVVVTKELPASPYLELARISRSGTDKPVREAQNPFDPDRDEINLLHRRVAFPHCYADVAVGEVGYVPATDSRPNAEKPNRAGLWNLVREGNGKGFQIEFVGPFGLAADAPPGSREPTLLYMAGSDGFKPLADAEVQRLSRLVASGTLLLGEAVGNSAEFTRSFQELASRLGAALRPVGVGHPLLMVHHVFPSVPPGARQTGQLMASEDGGVVFSSLNFGGAWQGVLDDAGSGSDAQTMGRERVRQAQEFGLNLVAWAHQRRLRYELMRLQ